MTGLTVRGIVVGIAGLCLVAGIHPATAQTYLPIWSPDDVEVAESAGAVVLTIVKAGPGQVRYRTEDGDCGKDSEIGGRTTDCGPGARAPDDYRAVSGQLVFTEAGSKKITIPIVDDLLDEGDSEAFTVFATEVDEKGGWVAGTNAATVRISDDDGVSNSDGAVEPAAAPPSTTTTTRRLARGSSPIVTVPPGRGAVGNAAPGATPSPSSNLAPDLASDELRPGPGFELTSDEGRQPAPDRPAETGGTGGSGVLLGLGLGTAALVGGGVMWARQRRRWSPTRA